MLLDRFLPEYHLHERHSIAIEAPARVALAEARRFAPRDVPVFVALMALRSVPALLLRRRSLGLELERPIVDQFVAAGFVLLADEADEFVLGAVGRFWRPSGGLRHVAPDRFRAFAEPGWAKTAVNFRAEERDGRTLLSSETRILGTDESARRSFRRYWRLVHPGSALIRVAWLRAVKRRSER